MIKLNYLVRVAMIAAIYVVLNIIFAPISYGPIQVRIAEALVILPFIDSSAIMGLFLGCILANFIGPLGMVDVIGGSLCTLIVYTSDAADEEDSVDLGGRRIIKK